jgi:hypothetical protein
MKFKTILRAFSDLPQNFTSPKLPTMWYLVNTFLPHVHAQGGKVIGRGIVVVVQKLPLLEIQASERLESTMNQSNSANNWPQCASNQGIRSTSVTNSVFLLEIVATPIDRPTQHAGFLLMRTTNWPSTLVKIVEM